MSQRKLPYDRDHSHWRTPPERRGLPLWVYAVIAFWCWCAYWVVRISWEGA